MKKISSVLYLITILVFCSSTCFVIAQQDDPNSGMLSSWNEGKTKSSIINFVKNVTDSASTDFITVQERIAVFDNDGTLISEQPVYFQMIYARSRIKELADHHPEWDTLQPFKAILNDDLTFIQKAGTENYTKIMMAAREGLNTTEQTQSINMWLDTAVHPQYKIKYIDMVYLPMLELLSYLRANNFKTFIVSGGDTDFMRVFSEKVYGIPPEQVVGSFGKVKYEITNGKQDIISLNEIEHINNKDGKAVGIYQFIGRIPAAAFGNSDGDYEMLQYTTSGYKNHFGLLIHHNDSIREFDYDRNSLIGKLDKGIDDSEKNNWIIVDMKNDWKTVYK